MTDYIKLALRYGGFTSLDKVYLQHLLADLTKQQKLAFITPPPSVINAYFAELYQKKSPEAATAYFLEMSRALTLYNSQPSFAEKSPFIRLNLSGKSYGFAYESQEEIGLVFPENEEEITGDLLFEIAQIFPHYLIFLEKGQIKMRPFDLKEQVREHQVLSDLTDLYLLDSGIKKLASYNQEELLQFAEQYKGNRYYRFDNRSAIIYLI